jgi:hypothetical protein
MATRGSKKAEAKPKIRLRLSKETLRDLDASGTRDVKGGVSASYLPTRMKPPLTGKC